MVLLCALSLLHFVCYLWIYINVIFLISGSALLACPVTDPGITEVKVLLPGSDEVSSTILLLNDVSCVAVHRKDVWVKQCACVAVVV